MRSIRTNKLSWSGVILAILVLLFVLDYHCFYLVAYPNWMKLFVGNSFALIVSTFGCLLTLLMYQKYKRFAPKLYNYIIAYYVIGLYLWLFIVFRSIILYPSQPISFSFGAHSELMYIGLILPWVTVILTRERKKTNVLDILNCIVFIWYLLLAYQYVSWISSGQYIFHFADFLDDQVRTRFYGIRLGLGSIGNLMILYNFEVVIERRKQGKSFLFSIVQLTLGVFTLIFVQQTRAFSAVVLVSMLGIAIVGAKKAGKRLFVYTSIVILILYLIFSGMLEEFINSFSSASSNILALGTTIRVDAIKYYLERFVSSLFLGDGFTSYLSYPEIQHGSAGQFYYSDVGIFGLLAEIGIASIWFYILPLFRAVGTVRIIFKKKLQRDYAFYIGLVIYLLGTSVTLIVTDSFRAMAYPLIFAISEYTRWNIIKRESNEMEGSISASE